ncbi:hypothetical protein SUGI_0833310 [Cryptomeria japonica]|uniref:serine/threonine-protein kinase haspin homolog isoform X2 n=1 Tax=Cryptomeria japonica TaxID=3369 RepID=UPI002414B8EB|nr:serine/threonine-protein kinase haspin homolog isoform X2 [Cryptomeria japonica]GLJ40445.1 hypothetical protein SUGI_0833310 [Cryptomeria japonica]
MGSQRGVPGVRWSDIVGEDDHPTAVYTRKGGSQNNKEKQKHPQNDRDGNGDTRPPATARNTRRQSWICRALSSRGSKSIASHVTQDERTNKRRKSKKKGQSRVSNKRMEIPPIDFIEEKKSYFKDVDSFELDEEEGPSPVQAICPRLVAPSKLDPLQSLVKGLDVVWEESGGESFSHNSDGELSNCSDLISLILNTPSALSQSSASSDILISSDGFSFHKVKPSKQPPPEVSDDVSIYKIKSSRHVSLKESNENQDATAECPDRGDVIQEPVNTHSTVQENRNKSSLSDASYISEAFGKMEIIGVQKSQNVEYTKVEGKYVEENDEAGVSNIEDPFSLLTSEEDEPYEMPALGKILQICGQTRPIRLFEACSEFCDANNIIKIGEGTFGEAFKGGGNVFKIVPFDGDFLVNGEAQKTCAELVTEVSLSKTLNCLRSAQDRTANNNTCMNFIETKAIRVCEGTYDAFLVNAWEDWDEKHTSENDHPMAFPEKQLYATFILADGGQDLESFVLLDFDEARSLLMQVTSSLAIAEAACEFEHRDLHWGNILLNRDQRKTIEFILQGKRMEAQTFGLTIAIIDFTLSRINTGNQVLYFDLSSDPALFEGPKRNTQSETYRRMLNVTKGNWEGRYPKTNSLWLHYIADTLLTKKVFRCSPKDKRSLQAFRKRLLMYDSAEAALSDAFFDGMWVEN